MVECPYCEGTGTDGNDRSVPPNDYICKLCNGNNEISEETERIWHSVEHLIDERNAYSSRCATEVGNIRGAMKKVSNDLTILTGKLESGRDMIKPPKEWYDGVISSVNKCIDILNS